MFKKINYQDINTLMDHNLEVVSRSVFIDDDIDEKNVSKAIKSILYLDSVSNEPIKIFISSFGGSVYDGLALYDILRACSSPIHTHGVGKIMSMATYVFLAGDKRSLYKRSTVMIHELSDTNIGSLEDLKLNILESERIQAILYKICGDRTYKKKLSYWKNIKRDTYFTADQCIELGIAQYIVDEQE